MLERLLKPALEFGQGRAQVRVQLAAVFDRGDRAKVASAAERGEALFLKRTVRVAFALPQADARAPQDVIEPLAAAGRKGGFSIVERRADGLVFAARMTLLPEAVNTLRSLAEDFAARFAVEFIGWEAERLERSAGRAR